MIIVRFLGALAVLVALAAMSRQAARWLGQPAVLGELLLGVALGPALLGWLWPDGHELLLGGENAPLLEALAWIGLVLFILTAGAEMEWRPSNSVAAIGLASGGLLVPAVAGVLVATAAPHWFFAGEATPANVTIVATIMAVTALPVLAGILADLGLLGRPIAVTTMSASTIDDVVAWTALALAAGAGSLGLTGTLAGNLLLVAAVFVAALVLDRMLTRVLSRWRPADAGIVFAVVVAAALAAAAFTHLAGLHAVVGALAVGAVVSRHPELRREVLQRFRGVAAVLLLPLFFILTMGEADVRLLLEGPGLVAAAAVLLVATLSKVAGCYVGGRLARLGHARALASGILMNARGAVGLLVAKVGHDSGLLAAHGFALMVVVILLTTLLTAPMLSWYARRAGTDAL